MGNDSLFASQTEQTEWGYEASGEFWYKLTGENPFDMFIVLEHFTAEEMVSEVEGFRITQAIPCSEAYKLQIITWVVGEDLGKKIACDEKVSYIIIPQNWERSLRPFPEEVEKALRALKIPEGALRT